jgi:hypothetical protein
MTRTAREPLFRGLVFNQEGEPADVAYVGDEPHYVIHDAGFRRHVPSEYIDRQILKWFQDQLALHREVVTQEVLALLGRDDLFSKAIVDASMKNLDELLQYGLPEEARAWLGMLGFRAIVDVHGDLVAISGPIQEEE